ncbi:basic proline-rich protein-like [Corvus cornix cornix]|uniref:basic proline-rich protein-like n=1 Tax=Corvus cornix cornix TaxID=932674 RepID=UPI00194DC3D3|nr:basic proline-rich protein-like [Corvus cornix cornix]
MSLAEEPGPLPVPTRCRGRVSFLSGEGGRKRRLPHPVLPLPGHHREHGRGTGRPRRPPRAPGGVGTERHRPAPAAARPGAGSAGVPRRAPRPRRGTSRSRAPRGHGTAHGPRRRRGPAGRAAPPARDTAASRPLPGASPRTPQPCRGPGPAVLPRAGSRSPRLNSCPRGRSPVERPASPGGRGRAPALPHRGSPGHGGGGGRAAPGEGSSATARHPAGRRPQPNRPRARRRPGRARATPPNSTSARRRRPTTAPGAPRFAAAPPRPGTPAPPRQRQVPPVPELEQPCRAGQRHRRAVAGRGAEPPPPPPAAPRPALSVPAAPPPLSRRRTSPSPPARTPPRAAPPPPPGVSRDRFHGDPVRTAGRGGSGHPLPPACPRVPWVRGGAGPGCPGSGGRGPARGGAGRWVRTCFPRRAAGGGRRAGAGPCPRRRVGPRALRAAVRRQRRRRRRHWQRQPECEGESEPRPRGLPGAVVRPPGPGAAEPPRGLREKDGGGGGSGGGRSLHARAALGARQRAEPDGQRTASAAHAAPVPAVPMSPALESSAPVPDAPLPPAPLPSARYPPPGAHRRARPRRGWVSPGAAGPGRLRERGPACPAQVGVWPPSRRRCRWVTPRARPPHPPARCPAGRAALRGGGGPGRGSRRLPRAMRDTERHGTVRRPQVCHRPPPAAPGPAGPEAAAPPVVPGQARSAPSRTAPALTASPGPGPRRPRHPHGPRRPAASQSPGAARRAGTGCPARPCPATPPRAVPGPAQHRPVPAPLPRPLRPAPPPPSARPPCTGSWGGPRGSPLLHDPEGRAGPGPPGPRRGGCSGTGRTGWSRGGGRGAATVSPVPVRWHRAPAWSGPGGGQGPGASRGRAPQGCGVGSERGGAVVTAARDPAWAPGGLAALSPNWCEERWATPQAAPSHGGRRPPTSPGMAPLRGEGPDYSISAESPAQPHGTAAGPAPLPTARVPGRLGGPGPGLVPAPRWHREQLGRSRRGSRLRKPGFDVARKVLSLLQVIQPVTAADPLAPPRPELVLHLPSSVLCRIRTSGLPWCHHLPGPAGSIPSELRGKQQDSALQVLLSPNQLCSACLVLAAPDPFQPEYPEHAEAGAEEVGWQHNRGPITSQRSLTPPPRVQQGPETPGLGPRQSHGTDGPSAAAAPAPRAAQEEPAPRALRESRDLPHYEPLTKLLPSTQPKHLTLRGPKDRMEGTSPT